MSHRISRVDRKYPLYFTFGSFSFFYVLQYPLSVWMLSIVPSVEYSVEEWTFAYAFVACSTVILATCMYVGMTGRQALMAPVVHCPTQNKPIIKLRVVSIVCALFFFWSYLMMNRKIGMTIYADFEPLPFKLVGILYYGRLFIQPMILTYIAMRSANHQGKWFVFGMLVLLGGWVSLVSGSRFVSIMFSFPVLLLFNGRSRYGPFAAVVLLNVTIATLTRYLFLPYLLGDDYIHIYANEESQAAVMENIASLPISYVVARTMGMGEVLMTMKFGTITPGFDDSLSSLISAFVPFMPQGTSASIKQVYGLSDDVFGGLGLDLFSNLWVMFGGNLYTYGCGLALLGWMLGKTYRLFSIGLMHIGFKDGSMLIFTMLFLLAFEGRVGLFPPLLLLGWIISRNRTISNVISVIRYFRGLTVCSR